MSQLVAEIYVCDVCDKVYYSKEKLDTHKKRRNHENVGDWVCYKCGRRFSSERSLLRHEEWESDSNRNIVHRARIKELQSLGVYDDARKRFFLASQTKEALEKKSRGIKASWKDPIKRQNRISARWTDERKLEQSKLIKGLLEKFWNDPEYIEHMSKLMSERWNNDKMNVEGNEERSKKISEALKIRWRDSIYRDNQIKLIEGGLDIYDGPTKPEQKLIDIVDEDYLPFEYVGDMSFILISKEGLPFNPDFIHDTEKKAIEVFGVYWHSLRKGNSREDAELERIKMFKDIGWKCIVIWSDELGDKKRILDKLENFIGDAVVQRGECV